MKELEKAIVNLVKGENADIKQKQDMARLHIHHCQMVLVNTFPHSSSSSNQTTTVKDAPLTQVLLTPQPISSPQPLIQVPLISPIM